MIRIAARIFGLIIALTIIGVVILLGGCSVGRFEGAGFTNGGVQRPPACIKGRKGNVETWGKC